MGVVMIKIMINSKIAIKFIVTYSLYLLYTV